jgi:hypothetical protein
MRFIEINQLSVYVALTLIIMVAAPPILVSLRWLAIRFDALRYIGPPALFGFGLYAFSVYSVVILSVYSIVLLSFVLSTVP